MISLGDKQLACLDMSLVDSSGLSREKFDLSGYQATPDPLAPPGHREISSSDSGGEITAENIKAGFGDALSNMYGFYTKRMPRGGDLELTKKLNPDVKTLAMYLKDCKDDFRFE